MDLEARDVILGGILQYSVAANAYEIYFALKDKQFNWWFWLSMVKDDSPPIFYFYVSLRVMMTTAIFMVFYLFIL